MKEYKFTITLPSQHKDVPDTICISNVPLNTNLGSWTDALRCFFGKRAIIEFETVEAE